MAMEVTRVNVWAGPIADRPGGLAAVMSALAAAGVDLEFVIARRDTAGRGVVFVAPISGAKQIRAAKKAGLTQAISLGSLRVSTANKAGLCAEITQQLATAGINLRGYSAAALGRQAVVYLAFDNPADSAKAARLLKAAANKRTLAKERTMKTPVKKKAAPETPKKGAKAEKKEPKKADKEKPAKRETPAPKPAQPTEKKLGAPPIR